MNKETIEYVKNLFINTNFANLFSLPGLFKIQAGLLELKTEKFVKWVDKLNLPIVSNVIVNCADMSTDKQMIYGYNDFLKEGYGELISRSIAVPAVINKGIYADGGLYDNPHLIHWLNNPKPIFVSQLMMPYHTTPTSRIEKLFYAWDVKAYQTYQCDKGRFKNLVTIYPSDGEVSSFSFGISKEKKLKMIEIGYKITNAQLEFLKLDKQDEPTDICLGLSGGGIRAGYHIGMVQSLLEHNYIPTLWSGTSGGALIAVLMAAYSSIMV